MGTALVLLTIVAAIVVIPLLFSRLTRRYSSEVDDYLDEQHADGSGRRGSWPAGGGHIGL